MEPIVTRSIRILTVGLATEYESYYTARHTRCCCVFCLLFFACSRVLYDIFIVVCAERTAGVCLRQYMCGCFSFIRSFLRNAKRSSHTLTLMWCECDRDGMARKDKRGKRKIDCSNPQTHVNVFCRKKKKKITHSLRLELNQFCTFVDVIVT